MERSRRLEWVAVPGGKCSNDGLTVFTVPREYPRTGRRGGVTIVQNGPVSLGRWHNSLNEPIDITAGIHQLFTAADFADYSTAQANVNERIKALEAEGRIIAVGHYTDPYTVKMTPEYDRWYYGLPYAVAEFVHDSKYRPITRGETLPLYQVLPGAEVSIGFNTKYPDLIIESTFNGYDDRDEELSKARKNAKKRALEYVAAGSIKQVGTVEPGGYDLMSGHALPYTVSFTDTETEKDFFDRAVKRFHRIMDSR